jgi:hypothetical protein
MTRPSTRRILIAEGGRPGGRMDQGGRPVGRLWQAYQQISNRSIDDVQGQVQVSLAQRVAWLEQTVVQQNEVLGTLIQHLEQRFGEDLNGDQRIG